MKNLIKQSIVVVIILTFTACKKETKNTNMMNSSSGIHSMENSSDMKNEDNISTLNKEILNEIIDSYIVLKNALVADNEKDAANAGKAMIKAFNDFKMGELTEAQHKDYMEIAEASKEHAEHIVKSDINHQREHFESLSTDINDLITLIGTNKTLYQVFCPMYNKNKGGTWLSEIKEIKNPYFGSKMLSCGEIKSTIN